MRTARPFHPICRLTVTQPKQHSSSGRPHQPHRASSPPFIVRQGRQRHNGVGGRSLMVVCRTPYMVVKREKIAPAGWAERPVRRGELGRHISSARTRSPAPGIGALHRESSPPTGDSPSGRHRRVQSPCILMSPRRIRRDLDEMTFSPVQGVFIRSVTRLTHSTSNESVTPAQGLG